MPYLVNFLIYTTVPDRAPLIIRPILRMAFNALISQLIEPRLKENAKMVRINQCYYQTNLTRLLPDRRAPCQETWQILRGRRQFHFSRLYDAVPIGGVAFAWIYPAGRAHLQVCRYYSRSVSCVVSIAQASF
jgi:hypothetical protein